MIFCSFKNLWATELPLKSKASSRLESKKMNHPTYDWHIFDFHGAFLYPFAKNDNLD